MYVALSIMLVKTKPWSLLAPLAPWTAFPGPLLILKLTWSQAHESDCDLLKNVNARTSVIMRTTKSTLTFRASELQEENYDSAVVLATWLHCITHYKDRQEWLWCELMLQYNTRNYFLCKIYNMIYLTLHWNNKETLRTQ